MENTERQKRAESRRRRMVITCSTIENSDADPAPIFGAEAVSLAAILSRQAWAFSRRPVPKYKRHEIPVRFIGHDSE